MGERVACPEPASRADGLLPESPISQKSSPAHANRKTCLMMGAFLARLPGNGVSPVQMQVRFPWNLPHSEKGESFPALSPEKQATYGKRPAALSPDCSPEAGRIGSPNLAKYS